MTVATGPVPSMVHGAFIYTNDEDYVGGVVPFVRAGMALGQPTVVFVPGRNGDLLRAALNEQSSQVTFLDAREVGRNPARIIAAARGFAEAHAGSRIRVVGEPIWAERSAAEIGEVTRHEACVNVLFADIAATVLCPYDAGAAVLGAADRTHPYLIERGVYRPNNRYIDPAIMLAISDSLPAAPGDPDAWAIGPGQWPAVAREVRDYGFSAGLAEARLAGLVDAVGEVVTNTTGHTERPVALRLWRDSDDVICEISDDGQIMDPLIGWLEPAAKQGTGRGLWRANQICDLVEIRSGHWGSTVRLHMTVDRTPPAPPAQLRAELDAAVARTDRELSLAERLCQACVDMLKLDGAAISLIMAGVSQGTLGASSELGRRLDELQFTFGEGPCLDAVALGWPVLVEDLAEERKRQWSAYATAAMAAGVRAVFALPIEFAPSQIGVLELFSFTPRSLSEDELAIAALFAQIAASPSSDLVGGVVDWEAESHRGEPWPALPSLARAEVYQAAGIVMRQLQVGSGEALVRMRAHAFAHTLTTSEVAIEIIEHRLTLAPDDPGTTH